MGQCLGDGNITMYTGAGRGEDEMRFPMKTWKRVIIYFKNLNQVTFCNDLSSIRARLIYWKIKKFAYFIQQVHILGAQIYLQSSCRWAT